MNTFNINNREYTIEKSHDGDYYQLSCEGVLIVDEDREDFKSENVEAFKNRIEAEASKRMPWWCLIGAIFEWGSDPELIEDEDYARNISDVIEEAQAFSEVTDKEEVSEIKARLGFGEQDEVRRIYTFVNGSGGSFCLDGDF